MADLQRLVDLPQRVAVGLGAQVDRPVAEFRGPVPQRGEHQVGLLPVEGTASEHRPGLHEQHRLVWTVEKVRSELIREDPTPHHAPILPRCGVPGTLTDVSDDPTERPS
ncbi:hypothetical protein GCM10009779_48170 [Polymorphospora rubra]|uniref:Uncharacterized protein n=1 Tax=Polymorphospora rubra TaxID=338584 RepID=A0A810MW17_9ACTN|nr:hypothetical protein Prubr_08540 [Polymorphospora rubra]